MYEYKRYIQIAKDRTFLVLPLPLPVLRRINVDVVSRYHRKQRTFFFYIVFDFAKDTNPAGNALTSCFDQNYTLEQINDNTN